MLRNLVVASTLLLCLSCTNESVIVGPIGPILSIRAIVPDQGTPGDFVTIYGAGLSDLRLPYAVSFNGATAWPESYSDTVVIVRVPLDASTGPLRVLTENDSVIGPAFTVLPSCGRDACVKLYSGPPLTEQQSWTLDCFFRYVKWTAAIIADTVVLSQSYCYGDDSFYSLILRFWNNPPFQAGADGLLLDREITGTSTLALKGLVLIQSWDRTGVVSGKVSWWLGPSGRVWRDFVFWHDFSK
jgi:hypothetical protein